MEQVSKLKSFTINQAKLMFYQANISILIAKSLQPCNFTVKVTLTQVLCCECCKIFKNNYFTEKRLVPVFKSKRFSSFFDLYNVILMEKTTTKNFCRNDLS